MRAHYIVIALALVVPACGKKKPKGLGDKKTACENIYKQYSSRQDPKVWADACMAAPDENVRCVNLIMEEAKDSACKKLVNSPERTNLVLVLNGKPEASAEPSPSASADPSASPDPSASAEPSASPEASPAAITIPPPPEGKLTAMKGGNNWGTFDSDKSLYIKAGDKRIVAMARDCEKFSCSVTDKDGVNSEKLQKVCPDATYIEITIDRGDPPGEPVVGPIKVEGYISRFTSMGGLTGSQPVEGSSLTEVSAKQVSGKIDFKDSDSGALGSFVAKVCK